MYAWMRDCVHLCSSAAGNSYLLHPEPDWRKIDLGAIRILYSGFLPEEVNVKLPALSMAIVLLAGPAVALADDLDDAYQKLKDAVAKKDAPLVKKLVAEVYPLACEAAVAAAPKDDDEKPAWTTR